MGNYIRYTLAAVCFAASVGCLALGWRSYTYMDLVVSPYEVSPRKTPTLRSAGGSLELSKFAHRGSVVGWTVVSIPISEDPSLTFLQPKLGKEWFGRRLQNYYFPHWYPALIFALAGIGVLRFRRQFSIRSVLVAVSVIAALLGMAVVL